MRDPELELSLQHALNSGNNVWVIGDIHGFGETLRILVDKLNIQGGDFVVLLGDLIDRGPNSYDVVQFVKTSNNIVTVKGNHEKMMINSFFKLKEITNQNNNKNAFIFMAYKKTSNIFKTRSLKKMISYKI